VRLPGLSRPVGFVFDEIFYARNACRYVIGTPECGISELASRAHPPLGNWIIGLGIKAFGFDAFGWRVMAAVVGTLSVTLLFLLVRRLLASLPDLAWPAATVGAFAAAGLLAVDPLHVVQSRVGMLDVFVTFFVILAVLFAVLDRDRARRATWDRSPEGWLASLALGRPWRLLAGASLGAATAVKWSGAYAALAVVPLIVASEIAARRTSDDPAAVKPSWGAATWRMLREEGLRTVVLLGLVPVAVYLAAYIGRMPGEVFGLPWQDGTFWRNVWEHQQAMLTFHTGLEGSHPYESPPWSWLLLKRPVAYFFTADGGTYREILAIGSPVGWWAGAVALAATAVSWWRAGWEARRPEPVLLAGALAVILPWLVLSGSRSQVFLWYLLPAIPFLYGAVGLWVAWAWRSLLGRAGAALLAAGALATFAFFFPILTALPLDPDGWRSRMWFTDCARPGAPTLELPDDSISAGPAPSGWCWI
jgi:dolichyl-phosphate-mannose-protein mannosyltransferase